MEQKTASQGMIIGGYVAAVLCGLLGLIIPLMLRLSKVTNADGIQVPAYDEASRKQGKTMLIVWAVVFVVGIILYGVMGASMMAGM